MTPAHRLTYVGHATTLIEMDGVRLLTDPVLRRRVGHLRRHTHPVETPIRPSVDAVLISHLHWDHFDPPSLRLLGRSVRLIVPAGAGDLLHRWGFRRVEEIRAGEVVTVGSLAVEATPANHSGFRPPFGPNADCVGFMVRGSRRIYFAGDTDLFPEMASLAENLDTALLPVWGWGPTLGSGHLDPRRAAEALRLLRPRRAIPIHWGTFRPIGMGWSRMRFLTHPPQAFARHAAEMAPEVEVRVVAPGRGI